jgi:membrane-associated phospholipid phosphatase
MVLLMIVLYFIKQIYRFAPFRDLSFLFRIFSDQLYQFKLCMRKTALLFAFGICLTGSVSGQPTGDSLPNASHHYPVYGIKPAVDIPLAAGGAAWDLYGFAQIGKKNPTSLGKLQTLKISDLDWFDRWAVHPYSHTIDRLSYIPFYVGIPLPLIFFGLDPRMRKDFWKLTFLYGEAMILTGVCYTSAVHYISRLRPLVYESVSPLPERQSANSRNSFFAGHVALVGTSVFFIARSYADYHPESRYKWVVYGGAAFLTGLTGYLRNMAGEHFPTDVALGTLVGVASGMLTPVLHRIHRNRTPIGRKIF